MAAAHRMYARALFEAARDEGRLEPVREELGDFVDTVRSEERDEWSLLESIGLAEFLESLSA